MDINNDTILFNIIKELGLYKKIKEVKSNRLENQLYKVIYIKFILIFIDQHYLLFIYGVKHFLFRFISFIMLIYEGNLHRYFFEN